MRRFFCACMAVCLFPFLLLFPSGADGTEGARLVLSADTSEADGAGIVVLTVSVSFGGEAPPPDTADGRLFAVLLRVTLPDGWAADAVLGTPDDFVTAAAGPDGALRVLWDGSIGPTQTPGALTIRITVPPGADRAGEITVSADPGYPTLYLYDAGTDTMTRLPLDPARLSVTLPTPAETDGEVPTGSESADPPDTGSPDSGETQKNVLPTGKYTFLGWQDAWEPDGTGAVRFIFAAPDGPSGGTPGDSPGGCVLPVGGGSLSVTVDFVSSVPVPEGRTAVFTDGREQPVPLMLVTVTGLRAGKGTFLIDTGAGLVLLTYTDGIPVLSPVTRLSSSRDSTGQGG